MPSPPSRSPRRPPSPFSRRWARSGTPVRWLALNREFHNTLYRASNKTRLLKFTDDLRVMMERYLRISLTVLYGFDIAQQEHEAIIAAYRAKDANLAARRAGAHLRRTADMVADFLSAHLKA